MNNGHDALHAALAPCRRAGATLSVLTGVRSLALVALALTSRGVLNSAPGGDGFFLWCAALGILSIAIPILNSALSAFSGRITDRTCAEVRQTLFAQLQHKDCASLRHYHSGHLFSRLTGDCATACQQYTSLYPSIFGQLMQLAGAFIALCVLRPALAAVLTLCGAAAAVAGLVFRRFLKGKHLAERRAGEGVTACLQEGLEQLETDRVTASPGETVGRFSARQALWLRVRESLRRCSIGGWLGFSLLVYLGSGGAILWGALSIRAGTLTIGDLTAILQLIGLFRSPVTGLTGVQSQFAAADAARERLEALWSLPEEPTGPAIPPQAKCRALVLKNLTFTYEGEERPVFKGVTARIPLDGWVCLTGASGRGKSTLYRLILGLYHPQEGEILLETDRGTFPCGTETRQFFGFVPQEPALFSGTVRENLHLSRPDASDEALWQALEDAECGFLKTLPLGLDTPLGEGGQGLSAGQRQRLAIARALLRPSQVLLLDEITSALDAETERRVLHKLQAHYPAALTATHRTETPMEMQMCLLKLEEWTAGGEDH